MGNATSVIVYTNYNKIGGHWKGYNDCKGRVRQSRWKGLGDAKKDKEVELTMALSQRITGGVHHIASEQPIARKGKSKRGENEWMEATGKT